MIMRRACILVLARIISTPQSASATISIHRRERASDFTCLSVDERASDFTELSVCRRIR